jgi:hypothetical protein
MFLLILTTTLLSLAKFAAGWGADTHPTIGYLAERYFLSETVTALSFHINIRKIALLRFSQMKHNSMDPLAVPQIGLIERKHRRRQVGISLMPRTGH